MDREERVFVRLSANQLTLLSELVRQGKYQNEAAAVKDAVSTLIRAHFTDEEAETVIVNRSKQILNLDDFTSNDSPADEILYDVIVRGLKSDRKES